MCRKPLAERLSLFMEHLDEFEEERREWFVRREPLAEVIPPFVGDRCERFWCRKPLTEILHAIAEPLYANTGPLSLVLTTPRLRVSTMLRQSRRRAVGRGRAVPFAERLCEADERITEESRGHREFAPTPEPSPRKLDTRGRDAIETPFARLEELHPPPPPASRT